MDLAMRQGYGACALPLCGGGRLLLRRSETDQFLFFFSIFIFFVVFSCVSFVFSFMASPRSARTDALSTVREPSVLRLNARRALAADESFAVSRGVTLDACFNCGELAATYAPTCSQRVVYRDALSNNDPVPDGFVVDEDATDLDEPASDDPSLSDRRGTCLAGVLRWPASRGVSPRTCSRPREHGTRAKRAIEGRLAPP